MMKTSVQFRQLVAKIWLAWE